MKMKKLLGICAAALMVAACTNTVSGHVDENGQISDVRFPKLEHAQAIKEGIFPNLENLRKIAPGVTKDDLYYLIGRPHFAEMHGAHEWDYIFKFRNPSTGEVEICQYKVGFDKHMKAQSFFWLPAGCGDYLNRPTPVAEAPVVRTYKLSSDALFAFDGSDLSHMLPRGRAELEALAADLAQNAKDADIRITGYTDRLGSEAYNKTLSEKRAQTVRQYLINHGVPAAGISARGMGEEEPVVECSQSNRKALIQCLQPNRRVVIDVMARR